MPGHLEALAGHQLQLAQEPLLVRRAVFRHVDDIVAHQPRDLAGQLRGMGVRTVRARRQETGHLTAVQRSRDRERLRDPHYDRFETRAPNQVPQPRVANLQIRRDPEVFIRPIPAVAEPVHPQHPRVPTTRHATPRRNRQRRYATLQPPVQAALGQSAEMGQVVEPTVEHETRLGPVQTDNRDFLDLRHGARPPLTCAHTLPPRCRAGYRPCGCPWRTPRQRRLPAKAGSSDSRLCVFSAAIVPEGRRTVAQGASPGLTRRLRAEAPEGRQKPTAYRGVSVALPGLLSSVLRLTGGLRPRLLTAAPHGAATLNTSSRLTAGWQ